MDKEEEEENSNLLHHVSNKAIYKCI